MLRQEIVQFAKVYKFKNDEGDQVEGAEIHILSKGIDITSDFGSQKGHKLAKHKVGYEVGKQILAGSIPALYDVEYTDNVDNNGRVSLAPVNFKFVKEFKLL